MRQTDRQTDRQADRQTGRQADRQTGRQADRQTDRDRQTETTGQAGSNHLYHLTACPTRHLLREQLRGLENSEEVKTCRKALPHTSLDPPLPMKS